jgi:hypothetical protein
MVIMNTRERVSSVSPETNSFGHGLENGTFLYLEDAYAPGKKMKIAWTSGHRPSNGVGDIVYPLSDTGYGHRSMPPHRVIAIFNSEVGLCGTTPAVARIALRSTLPYWVFK